MSFTIRIGVNLLTKVRPLWGLLVLFVGGGGVSGFALEGHVRVELLVEPSAIAAGVPFYAAVRLLHDPGWHTYYKEPGDSGLPTQIKWSLPEGFLAGEIQWPVPKKIVVPPLVDFGYEGEAALLVLISPPKKLDRAEVTLAARVSWLECKDVCVPGKADVSVVVPVAGTAGAPTAEMKAFFEGARGKLESDRHPGRAYALLTENGGEDPGSDTVFKGPSQTLDPGPRLESQRGRLRRDDSLREDLGGLSFLVKRRSGFFQRLCGGLQS